MTSLRALATVGHPGRALCLNGLSAALQLQYYQSGAYTDLTESIATLKEAVAYSLSSLSVRFDAAIHWILVARSHDSASLAEAYSSSLALADCSVFLMTVTFGSHLRFLEPAW